MSGRQNWRRGKRETICGQGHPLTRRKAGRGKGVAYCVTCRKSWNRRYYLRRRAGLVQPPPEFARKALKELEKIEA